MLTIMYLKSFWINYVRATPIYAIIYIQLTFLSLTNIMNPIIIEFFLPTGCSNVPATGENRNPPISKALNIIYHYEVLHDDIWDLDLTEGLVVMCDMGRDYSWNVHVSRVNWKESKKHADEHTESLSIKACYCDFSIKSLFNLTYSIVVYILIIFFEDRHSMAQNWDIGF